MLPLTTLFSSFLIIITFIFADNSQSCVKLIERANQEINNPTSRDSRKKALLELIATCPKVPEAFYNLGVAYFEDGDYAKALENINKALSLDKNEKFFLIGLVSALKLQNKAELSNLFKQSPTHAKKELVRRVQSLSEAYDLIDFFEPDLGCEFNRMALRFGLTEFILSHFQYCNEHPVSYFYNLFSKHLKGEKIADQDLQNFTVFDLSLFSENELAKLLEIFTTSEHFQEAELILRRLRKNSSINSDISCMGAYVLANRGKNNEAKQLYSGVKCSTGECFDTCARAALIIGELTSAKEILDEGIKNHPDNPYLYNSLGVVFRSLGNKKEAKQMFQKATELKPNFSEAKHNLNLE